MGPEPVVRARPWWPELLILGLLYLGYRQVRGLVSGQVGAAYRNAGTIVEITPPPGRALEAWANDVASAHLWLGVACSLFYGLLHLPVTAGVLVWLWRRHPGDYPAARTTLVLVSLLSLLAFWLFPVAPPRFAVPGAVDTLAVAQRAIGVPASQSVEGFVNDFAAFPSLHMAWACWCAWAVHRAAARPIARLAWLYPLVTGVVLVSTANHYVVDLVAGAGVVAVAACLVTWVHGPPARVVSGSLVRARDRRT